MGAWDLRKGRTGTLASLAAAMVVGLAVAPAAGAATTCEFDPGLGLVSVSMTEDNDTTQMAVSDAGSIQVRGGGPVLGCAGGTPNVTNTDTVFIVDNADNPNTPESGDGTTRVSIIEPSDFGPGKTIEPDGSAFSEIEFIVNLNDGYLDDLYLGGSPGPDNWVLGNSGLNWNAGSGDPSPDADLTSSTFDHIQTSMGGDDDVISAQGGAGTGAPFNRASVLTFTGDTDDDTVEGGNGPAGDLLNGGDGADAVRGFGGDDRVVGGKGDDTVDGGAGTDSTDYSLAPNGATVDLSQTTPQDTGEGTDTIAGLENVDGSNLADKLTGNASANVLNGGVGDDALDGRGGDDRLSGSIGTDTASYAQAPAGETVDLTAGLTSGGDGADTLADIENITGSPFADTLVGSPAANVLTGLAGNDTIAALAGADKVDVRDGGPDTASCGTEVDSAIADQLSVDAINADCETVDALPEPTPPATPTATPTATGGGATPTAGGAGATTPGGAKDRELTFALGGSRTQRVLRQKAIVVSASCPAEACSVVASASGKLGKRTLSLKPVAKRLAGGTAGTVKLRLSRAQRRSLRAALNAGKRPKLKVTVVAIDAAGNAESRAKTVIAKR